MCRGGGRGGRAQDLRVWGLGAGMRDKGQECRTDPSSQYNGVRKVHFSLSWRGRGEPASSPPQVAGEGAEEAPGPLRKEGGRLAWPASGAHRRGKGGKRGVRSGRLSGLRLPLARPSTLPLRPLSPSQGVLQSTAPPSPLVPQVRRPRPPGGQKSRPQVCLQQPGARRTA